MYRAVCLSAVALFALQTSPAMAQQVICHYTYGGETRTLAAQPVTSPYAVKTIDVGSFFHFRVVFEGRLSDVAAVKVYTYADRDDGPWLIHQASYTVPPVDGRGTSGSGWPNAPGAPGGFTGWQFVYEPMRDGELQYWCEYSPSAQPAHTAGNVGRAHATGSGHDA